MGIWTEAMKAAKRAGDDMQCPARKTFDVRGTLVSVRCKRNRHRHGPHMARGKSWR